MGLCTISKYINLLSMAVSQIKVEQENKPIDY